MIKQARENVSYYNLNETERATYSTVFYSNYFAGMRISTVYAELESTDKTLF